jgi:hypothetical protein
MQALLRWSRLTCSVAFLTAALVGPAIASPDARPVLVAVEISSGIACDAGAVRQVVRDELGRRVLSPAVATWEQAPDELIVALDRKRIVVSARAPDGDLTSRSIATPAGDDDRLRAVAWLAGNLLRDQVANSPAPEPEPSPTLAVHAPEPAPAASPMPVEPPATVALPVEVTTAAGAGSGWQLTATGGNAFAEVSDQGAGLRPVLSAAGVAGWQFELQRTREDGRILGLAIDIGPGETHLFGAAALWGRQLRRGRWYLEAAAAAGLELGKTMGSDVAIVDSGRTGTYSTVTHSTQVRPAAYGRAALTLGARLGDGVDVVARLSVHLTTAGLLYSFAAPTVGLRFRLP